MKRTAETAIYEVFAANVGRPDHILCKNLRREMIKLKKEFDINELTRELSDLYPFYEDSESELLRAYLFQFHEKHTNSPVVKLLCEKYNNDGVLVFQKDSNVYVVHSNNKAHSREAFPIQVSRWVLDMGSVGDGVYPTIEDALRADQLFHKKLVEESELEALQERMVNPESEHQERRKELTGSYCLS